MSLTSLSLSCSLMSPLLRILVLPQSCRRGGRCLRSLVPVISGGAITREMTAPPPTPTPAPTLLLSVPVSPSISLFSSSRFPPAAALHAPLSRLRRAHHGDGVCSACARTVAPPRQVILWREWTDVCWGGGGGWGVFARMCLIGQECI